MVSAFRIVIAKIVPLAGALVFLSYSAPASAILDGLPDNGLHANAGAAAVVGFGFCSGVLIAPQYFATAAHCIDEPLKQGFHAGDFIISFDDNLRPPTTIYHADAVYDDPTPFTNPAGNNSQFYLHDFGLIHLTTPVAGITPAKLPPIGLVDSLPTGPQNVKYQTVGIGVTDFAGNKNNQITPGAKQYMNDFISNDAWTYSDRILKISATHSGLCFGDSGGPTYVGSDTGMVIALDSYVTSVNCSSFGYASRLDTAEAHAFYDTFLH